MSASTSAPTSMYRPTSILLTIFLISCLLLTTTTPLLKVVAQVVTGGNPSSSSAPWDGSSAAYSSSSSSSSGDWGGSTGYSSSSGPIGSSSSGDYYPSSNSSTTDLSGSGSASDYSSSSDSSSSTPFSSTAGTGNDSSSSSSVDNSSSSSFYSSSSAASDSSSSSDPWNDSSSSTSDSSTTDISSSASDDSSSSSGSAGSTTSSSSSNDGNWNPSSSSRSGPSPSSPYFFSSPQPSPLASYGARWGHKMLSCDDELHVLGGRNGVHGTASNDIQTMKMNSILGVEEWSTTTAAAPWPARYSFGALVLPGNVALVYAGSLSNNSHYNDLWINHDCVCTGQWQQLPTTSFPTREAFGFVYFENQVVVVGGWAGSVYSNEVLTLGWYNESNRDFVPYSYSYGNAPWQARTSAGVVVFNNTLYVFGGYNWNSNPMNDVWSLWSSGGQWTQHSFAPFSGRASAAVWQNQIIYTLGDSNNQPARDVWSYSDITQQWTRFDLSPDMPLRLEAAMVSHEGRLVVTGGLNSWNYQGKGLLSDLWISDDQPFIPQSSSSSSSSTGDYLSSTASSSSSGDWYSSTSSSSTVDDSSSAPYSSSSAASNSTSSSGQWNPSESSSSEPSTSSSTADRSSSASYSSSSPSGPAASSSSSIFSSSASYPSTASSISSASSSDSSSSTSSSSTIANTGSDSSSSASAIDNSNSSSYSSSSAPSDSSSSSSAPWNDSSSTSDSSPGSSSSALYSSSSAASSPSTGSSSSPPSSTASNYNSSSSGNWNNSTSSGSGSSSSTGPAAPAGNLFNLAPNVGTYGGRYGHAMVSCDGAAHVLGGYTTWDVFFNDIQTLKRNSSGIEQWSTTTVNAPWPARQHFGALALPDGTVVVTGGRSISPPTFNDLWMNRQCVTNGKWQQVPITNYPGGWSFGFVYFQGSIVILGGVMGQAGPFSSQVFSLPYNANNRTLGSSWKDHSNAPWAPRQFPLAVVYSNSIFVFGGCSNPDVGILNDVWSLPSLGGTWIQLSAQNSPGRFNLRYEGVAAVWQNQIIYTTGWGNFGIYEQDVWSYSDLTRQWTQINATSLIPSRSTAAIVNHQGRLIITGGDFYDRSPNVRSFGDTWMTPDENEPSTSSSTGYGSSSTGPTFPTAIAFTTPDPAPLGSYSGRLGHSMVSCGGAAHILGGVSDTDYYNDVVTLARNGSFGVEQWTTTTPAAPWPARRGHGAVAAPDGTIMVTGGYFIAPTYLIHYFNDVWINQQCVTNGQWKQFQNAPYLARAEFGIAFFQGAFVVMGGWVQPTYSYSSEVFSLPYHSNNRTFASSWTSYGLAPWIARKSFSTVVYDGSLFIIGGYNSRNTEQYLNSVWRLPSLGDTWIEISPDGPAGQFSGRYGGVAGVFKNQIIYTTGTSGVFAEDIWSYSTFAQWTLINTTQAMPPRYGAALVEHEGRLIITGGYGDSIEPLADMWVLQEGSVVSSSSSTGINPSSSSSSSSTGSVGPLGPYFNPFVPRTINSYSARWGHAMLSCGDAVHILGGRNDGESYNDVVTLTLNSSGYEWVPSNVSAPWPERYQFGALVLPGDLVLVYAGSLGDNPHYNDLWLNHACVLQGQWEQLPTPDFPHRESFGFVYFNNSVIAVGGWTGTEYSNEIIGLGWYDHLNNAFVSSAFSWGNAPWKARTSAGVVVCNNKLYVFAGYNHNSNPQEMNDVWSTWALGVAWTQLPVAPFSVRTGGVAAIFLNQIVYTLGDSNNHPAGDIWSYSDILNQWTRFELSYWTPGRTEAAMVNHKGRLMITGGRSFDGNGTILDDFWVSETQTYDPASTSNINTPSSSGSGDVSQRDVDSSSPSRSSLTLAGNIIMPILLLTLTL